MTDAERDQNHVTVTLGVSSDDNVTTLPIKIDPITGRLLADIPTGVGTVTSVSVVTANGFAGSVATATTTPAITLSTTLNTPVLAGNGTALIAATTTGTGSTVVLATSPTLVTPILGTPTSGNLSNCTAFPVAQLSGLGTGVATALAINVGSAGAFVTFNGALGTPSSGTLTNATGLPISTGVSGLGTGVATALAVNTGSTGAVVLFNGALGTPSSGTLTNATGLPIVAGTTGTLSVARGGTALTAISALSIWAANSANTLVEVTPGAGNSIRINAGGTAWEAFTPSASVPTTITVANEATDTTCFFGFFTGATGDLGPKTNANLTFNSSTGVATFASTILTTTDINGGTIDGTTIGASSATTAIFTTATANSFVPNSSSVPSNGLYLPAANTLGWAINSGAEMQLTSTALSPAADGGSSLGTTALGWQNLFGNTGFVLNIENSDWVATHTAGILTVGTGDLRVTNAGTNTASVVTVGGTQTLSAKTLTAPKFVDGGFIADANGNEEIIFTTTASAVNEITIANAATGTTGPLIKASGETNVDIRLSGKGTGKVHNITAEYGDINAAADGGTVTFDLSLANSQTVTLGGNRTLALSNAAVGQYFMIRLLQDGTGTRTVTWFTTIKWAGGAAPTLTTTANKADSFGFFCTSSGNYDGFVIGQNI